MISLNDISKSECNDLKWEEGDDFVNEDGQAVKQEIFGREYDKLANEVIEEHINQSKLQD